MRVSLDFDGVLHDPHDRDPGRRMGKPIPGALEGVNFLLQAGHELIIHTCRATDTSKLEHVYRWLDYFGFPPLTVSITKPRADLYVDDRGWRFSGWEQLVEALLRMEVGG